MTNLRDDLDPLPERLKSLPIDSRGYPVPWFVQWLPDPQAPGKMFPEFRAMDPAKFVLAVRGKRCWVCGAKLGAYMTFTLGPMCGISRVSSEPPSHLECARWSARNCPFLSKPQMVRREGGPGATAEEIAAATCAGVMIKRNPGVMLLWTTRDYKLWKDKEHGGYLLNIGDPVEGGIEWWREGRAATRDEVMASVTSGLPALLATTVEGVGQAAALAAIMAGMRNLEGWYPQ